MSPATSSEADTSTSLEPIESSLLATLAPSPETPKNDGVASQAPISAPGSGSSAPLPSPNKDLPRSLVDLLSDDRVRHVLNLDLALDALLKRLKESISNCEEFAKFIKRKSGFQEDYDYQMRKLARNTTEYLRHNANHLRQDSFTKNFEQIVSFDDKLHSVGSAFVTALLTMLDELFQLLATMQKQRRAMKDDGKRREKEVADAILAAEKAKNRYDNFCLELERVRTNEPTKKFSLKSKTTSQQEEELMAKIEVADKDYSTKVAIAKRQKEELLNIHRPAISKTLKDLILEIDLAMSVQLQKYATWCENLLMNLGVMILPLRADLRQMSMKNLAASVDNEKDLYEYLLKYSGTGPSRSLTTVDYKVHPVLQNSQVNYNQNIGGGAFQNMKRLSLLLLKKNKTASSPVQTPATLQKVPEDKPSNRYSYFGGTTSSNSTGVTLDPLGTSGGSSLDPPSSSNNPMYVNENRSLSALPSAQDLGNLRPANPNVPKIFGGPLDPLCQFEGELVPLIVKTCISIIDNYGIELEGIYRTSGNNTKIHQLIDAINADRSVLDKLITNPDKIIDSDMYCIASLLKLYFAQLPQPLLTEELYSRFVAAVKIPKLALRRKRLHEVVFDLPDNNYFTLRAIIFHLCRIYEKQEINRMSARNLGIIWGPNLLPQKHIKPEDMSYQGQIVENLMYVAKDIFEPENE